MSCEDILLNISWQQLVLPDISNTDLLFVLKSAF
jgi:hypothetical protein